MGTIGSIAPFGFTNTEIPLFVDSAIFDSEYFSFNPADPTKSIKIQTQDLKKIYQTLSNPIQFFRLDEEEILFDENIF